MSHVKRNSEKRSGRDSPRPSSRHSRERREEIAAIKNKLCESLYQRPQLKDEEHKGAVIKKVLVTGIPNKSRGRYKGKWLIHWRITLQGEFVNRVNKDGSKVPVSITVDEKTDDRIKRNHKLENYEYPPDIIYDLRNYTGHSRNVIPGAAFDFNIADYVVVTFQDVINLIESDTIDGGQHKLNKFRTDAQGNGCLIWIKKVIKAMANEKHWLDKDAPKTYQGLDAIEKDQIFADKYIVALGDITFF